MFMLGCPDGCTACEETNEQCTECATGYYLEATTLANVADPVNRCQGKFRSPGNFAKLCVSLEG